MRPRSHPGKPGTTPLDVTERARSGRPRYFHLLWEDDLQELAPVLREVRDHLSEVISTWHSLYVLYFGNSRVLSDTEFTSMFEPALLRNLDDLLRKDMESYTRSMLELGDNLAARRVPMQEIIASLHLFEEAVLSVLPFGLPTELRITFDKLSHVRIILLVESYARSQNALAATRIKALETEARTLKPRDRLQFHGIIGKSAVMRELYERIEKGGQTRGTILVTGESGTGKELVARAIHECGSDPDSPFVALNCAALPKDLIESELFGYKRGAFSGANSEYLGLFRAAHGGTLFLDEITEMGVGTQSKLLRAIQEHRVRPVGATQEVAVNVRIIASTNRDPVQALREGRLREDLYYRLQAAVIEIPPLRARAEDIPLLAEYFLDRYNVQGLRKSPVVGIDRDALAAMCAYPWPGNVRELANAIEGAFTFGRTSTIGLADLPRAVVKCEVVTESSSVRDMHVPTFRELERETVRRALAVTGGNRSKAAKLLKISRKRLYAKIKVHGLQ
jgi:transcriptional regulator with PAS, ATPase and Fis domain